jgi:hypothetical protein
MREATPDDHEWIAELRRRLAEREKRRYEIKWRAGRVQGPAPGDLFLEWLGADENEAERTRRERLQETMRRDREAKAVARRKHQEDEMMVTLRELERRINTAPVG